MEYKIPCSWTVSGVLTIKADSLDAAKNKAYDCPLPEGDYVDESFEIDDTFAREMNSDLCSGNL